MIEQELLYPIRELLPQEKDGVCTLFKQNLTLIDRILFLLAFLETVKTIPKQKGCVLIAEDKEKVIGSISLRIIMGVKETFGLIDAVVIHKQYRGKGIGKALLDASLTWFSQRNCVIVYATADRYNSSSWNMFLHKGFKIFEILPQIHDLGIGMLRLWASEGYFFGIGTFFLKKTPSSSLIRETKPWIHFLVGIVGFAFIWCIFLLRSSPTIDNFIITAGIAGISAIFHEFMHLMTARLLKHQATFKAWIPGLIFALLISFFGGIYPSYGSTYVTQSDWSYNHDKRTNGIIYTAGPLTSLLLAIMCWSFPLIFPGIMQSYPWNFLFRIGFLINIVLVGVNLWPFRIAGGFPWDGVKIYRWNKGIWVILLLATVGVIVTTILI